MNFDVTSDTEARKEFKRNLSMPSSSIEVDLFDWIRIFIMGVL